MIEISKRITADALHVVLRSRGTVGLIGITSFVDPQPSDAKTIRYTKDGINFSDYLPFTLQTLQSLSFSPRDTVIFEIRVADANYTNLQLTPSVQDPLYYNNYFKKSLFAEFFGQDSVELIEWYLNVIDKLYNTNLVPKFIKRISLTKGSDKDFISFWRSVAMFFSYFVIYARKNTQFYTSDKLLREFLKERGLYVHNESTVQEMVGVMQNYYRTYAKRGTIQQTYKTQDKSKDLGEILHLINYKLTDEFLFLIHKDVPWCLGRSSPLYRGVNQEEQVQKYNAGNRILINSEYNYTLKFSVPSIPELDLQFNFFDKNSNSVNFVNSRTGVESMQETFAYFNLGNTTYFTFVFYSYKTQVPVAGDFLFQNNSHNFVLKKEAVYIEIIFKDQGVVFIPDFIRFTPSITNYSRCFLTNKEISSFWLINNNNGGILT